MCQFHSLSVYILYQFPIFSFKPYVLPTISVMISSSWIVLSSLYSHIITIFTVWSHNTSYCKSNMQQLITHATWWSQSVTTKSKSEPSSELCTDSSSTDYSIQLYQTKNFKNVKNTKHYPSLLLFTAHIKKLVPSADHHYLCLNGQRPQRPFLEPYEPTNK